MIFAEVMLSLKILVKELIVKLFLFAAKALSTFYRSIAVAQSNFSRPSKMAISPPTHHIKHFPWFLISPLGEIIDYMQCSGPSKDTAVHDEHAFFSSMNLKIIRLALVFHTKLNYTR